MRNNRLWNWTLSALVVFGFLACENEPLEGDFVNDDGVEDTSFSADVNGETFNAVDFTAQLADGVMTLSGVDAGGNTIVLIMTNAGECTFNLTTNGNAGSVILDGEIANPYLTLATLGGSGTATIDTYDADGQLISGSFNFIGAREIPDGAGGSVIQTISITNGNFNEIPFNLVSGDVGPVDCDNQGGGGGGTGIDDPADSFYALVDGVEFVDTSFTAELITIGSNEVVQITAITDAGAQIQFFVQPDLGVGTYDFEPIFNGSNLVVSYTAGDGTESFTSSIGSITFYEFGIVTGKIGASFSFTATDPTGGDPSVFEITEGAFNIDYITDGGAPENVFTATIDGEDYVPSSIEIVQNPFNGVTMVNVTTINEATNQSLSLSFPIDITTGDHEMSEFVTVGGESVGIFNPDIGNSILFKSNPGVLTVTSYQYSSGVIEGSFVFTAIDPLGNNTSVYEVTNGVFTLTIP